MYNINRAKAPQKGKVENMRTESNNFWLGDNEIVIVACEHTKYKVIEKYEEWKVVFKGTYEECREYCKKRVDEYEESIIF